MKDQNTFDVVEYTWSLMQAGNAGGFDMIEIGSLEPVPILGAQRLSEESALSIYLSAGIHGDEPAGSLALLKLLGDRFFSKRISWHILPLLNPIGMDNNQRENGTDVDLNRDFFKRQSYEVKCYTKWLKYFNYTFDLCICLHEDWESKGFYLYELKSERLQSLASMALNAAEPIVGIESAETIDGFRARDGIINHQEEIQDGDEWSEVSYLRKNHSTHCYVFETPSSFSLEKRVEAHCSALKAMLKYFEQDAFGEFGSGKHGSG